MTDNELDDIFKKRLENFSSGVPDDMWERIKKKDRDRKFIIWFRLAFIAGLLLLAGAGSVYFFVYNGTANNIRTNKNVNAQVNANAEKNRSLNNKKDMPKNAGTSKEIIHAEIPDLINKEKLKDKYYIKTARAFSGSKQIQVYKKTDTNNVRIKEDTVNNPEEIITRTDSANIKTDIAADIKSTLPDSSYRSDSAAKKTTDKKTFKSKLSLEVFASPDFPVNNISADDKQYERLLNDAGKMKLSYAFGLNIGVKITKDFSAKTGLRYTRISERINFTDSTLDTIIIYNNSYRSFDIPLMVSYSLKSNHKFTTLFTAGILLNISSKYKGAVPNSESDSLMEARSVYKNSMGSSLYLSVNLSKELNNKTDVFAEPFFAYRLNNMTNELQAFKQKIHTAGISIGLRYRLFKKED